MYDICTIQFINAPFSVFNCHFSSFADLRIILYIIVLRGRGPRGEATEGKAREETSSKGVAWGRGEG